MILKIFHEINKNKQCQKCLKIEIQQQWYPANGCWSSSIHLKGKVEQTYLTLWSWILASLEKFELQTTWLISVEKNWKHYCSFFHFRKDCTIFCVCNSKILLWIQYFFSDQRTFPKFHSVVYYLRVLNKNKLWNPPSMRMELVSHSHTENYGKTVGTNPTVFPRRKFTGCSRRAPNITLLAVGTSLTPATKKNGYHGTSPEK